ncbi:hypothetical protein AB0D13_35075 [Streptomyces sp. NPDC048430]|uniref:hypothetical protein n=1 Tax=Streptomyces sp. NPDC048430 TaxID=3155388 RepID=UPI00342CA789
MKLGLVQAVHSLAVLRRRHGEGILDRVSLLVTGDEEVGSSTSRRLLEEEAQRCRAVLVLEAAGPGGALKVERKGVSHYRLEVTGRTAHAGLDPETGVNLDSSSGSRRRVSQRYARNIPRCVRASRRVSVRGAPGSTGPETAPGPRARCARCAGGGAVRGGPGERAGGRGEAQHFGRNHTPIAPEAGPGRPHPLRHRLAAYAPATSGGVRVTSTYG